MEEVHRCLQCSYEFEMEFQLEHHVQRVHRNVYATELFHAMIEPDHCSCIFGKLEGFHDWDLYEHCEHKHHVGIGGNIGRSSFFHGESHEFSCKNCLYGTGSVLLLVKHTDSHRSAAKFAAPPHARVVRQKKASKKHTSTHAIREKKESRMKSFPCPQCSYRSERKGDLKSHMLKHVAAEDIVWFHCPKCPWKTKRKGELKQHDVLKHTAAEDIVWFVCAECSFRTRYKNNLKMHASTHDAPRPAKDVGWLRCAQCSYNCKYNRDLKNHRLFRHTAAEDISWFHCANCSYKCKQKQHLKRHMLKHAAAEDLEWFRCAKCSYRGKLKHHLKLHMLLKHVAVDENG